MEKRFIFTYAAEIGIDADSHAEAMDIMAKISRELPIADYYLETVYSKQRDVEYRTFEKGYDGIDTFIKEDK